MGLVGSVVVAGGDPGAPHFELAGGFAIARRFDVFSVGAGTRDTQLDKWGGPALFGADVIALVFGPTEHVALEATDSGDGCGFRHAPEVHDVEIVLIEGTHEFDRRRGAADDDANRRRKFPAAGFFLESVE